MLVSDIKRRVLNTVGDNNQLTVSDATIYDWLNDAQKIIAVNNFLLQKTATQSTVVGTSQYAVPTDLLKLHSVWVNGVKQPIYTLKEAEERTDLTQTAQSTPSFAYVWASFINLFPVPSQVWSLRINYTAQPAEITAVGDTPSIPVMYHSRLVDYCLAQVAQMDDNQELYSMKMNEFNGAIADLKDKPEWEADTYPYISVSDRDAGGGSEDFWT